ncbi:hypothetical protein GZH46_02284 [Fragariocoptes setiger]|uniref:Apple domain-containing protein n=1 Tax=Fragariocoptes setiger TaxID=1670756 RepID=A0ABQ7S721_9ACAR|nr:hypothetical protein GZH46_02284 [Fragariocoptes setiger]
MLYHTYMFGYYNNYELNWNYVENHKTSVQQRVLVQLTADAEQCSDVCAQQECVTFSFCQHTCITTGMSINEFDWYKMETPTTRQCRLYYHKSHRLGGIVQRRSLASIVAEFEQQKYSNNNNDPNDTAMINDNSIAYNDNDDDNGDRDGGGDSEANGSMESTTATTIAMTTITVAPKATLLMRDPRGGIFQLVPREFSVIEQASHKYAVHDHNGDISSNMPMNMNDVSMMFHQAFPGRRYSTVAITSTAPTAHSSTAHGLTDPAASNDIHQQQQQQLTLTGSYTFDQCVQICSHEPQCGSFSYCSLEQQCIVAYHTLKRDIEQYSVTDGTCLIAQRNYLPRYTQFVLNSSEPLGGNDNDNGNCQTRNETRQFKRKISPSDASLCASECSYEHQFHCVAFDYCAHTNTCYLHSDRNVTQKLLSGAFMHQSTSTNVAMNATTTTSTNGSQLAMKSVEQCWHYVRGALADFDSHNQQRFSVLDEDTIVRDTNIDSVDQCADECMLHIDCVHFQYCYDPNNDSQTCSLRMSTSDDSGGDATSGPAAAAENSPKLKYCATCHVYSLRRDSLEAKYHKHLLNLFTSSTFRHHHDNESLLEASLTSTLLSLAVISMVVSLLLGFLFEWFKQNQVGQTLNVSLESVSSRMDRLAIHLGTITNV